MFTKVKKQFNGRKLAFSTNGLKNNGFNHLEQVVIHMQNNELQLKSQILYKS